MSVDHRILEIYQTGPLTVVGFDGREILDQLDLNHCREELMALVAEHGCKILAFDLTGVKLMPSGLLGLLASMRKVGIEIHLYNPSEDVQEVLTVTQLNTVMPVHFVDVRAK